MYWIYRTHIYTWRNQYVQARLIDPYPTQLTEVYGPDGFRSPRQFDPYGALLRLKFQANPRHPHPDNYFNDAGFQLYSERLAVLLDSFDVRAESFPVAMIDTAGDILPGLSYRAYHVLEGLQPAMDEVASGWAGNHDIGIRKLVLDESRFEPRPMFYCNLIYTPLMRDDVKLAIEELGLTGFNFIAPESFQMGSGDE